MTRSLSLSKGGWGFDKLSHRSDKLSHRSLSLSKGPLVALVIAAVLTGCTSTPEPSASPDLVAARVAAGIEDCPQPPAAPAVEGGLPDLVLDCLGEDASVHLGSLRGPMVVNFWAQWCLPCRQEAPVLKAFREARPEIMLLGVDYEDPQPDYAIEFAQIVGWTHPQLVDPEKTTQAPLGLPGIPITVLIGEDGRILARHAGAFTELGELEDWVDEGLAA